MGKKSGKKSAKQLKSVAAPLAAAKSLSLDTGTQNFKLPNSAKSKQVFMTKANTGNGQALRRPDRRLINTDITSYRNGKDSMTVTRDFAISSPDLSASVDAYLRTAITPRYTAVAMNPDGTFNREATDTLQTLVTKFDVLKNYEEGFSNISSIRSVSEALAKEARYYGAMALELVLDKVRMPVSLQPVSVTTVEFKVTKDGLQPIQKIDNEEVSLDYPTFFYVSLDPDLLSPYPISPLEAALQPILFMQEFLNDLRRIVRNAIHPRIKVSLDSKAILAMMPVEYHELDNGQAKYLAQVVDSVAETVNNLSPEDALVFLDNVDVEYLTAGNISHDTEMTALKNIINDKISAGSKTLPSILGHGSSSNNIASTETLLFMKSAEGLQFALNNIFSQALTLAVRLLGYDVSVQFAYERIDLRPDSELEAFKAMKQSRVLELLSLGLMTDEEASLLLTGKLPDINAPKLSGTMFKHSTSSSTTNNPYSGTSQGTLNQNLDSDAPKNRKSGNGGKDGN